MQALGTSTTVGPTGRSSQKAILTSAQLSVKLSCLFISSEAFDKDSGNKGPRK